MIQYKITFALDVTGSRPAPNCTVTGSTLNIVLDDGYPKYGGDLIEFIEVYVSGASTGPFHLIADDGSVDDFVGRMVHISSPASDQCGCSWSRTTTGHLDLELSAPAENDTQQEWTFGAQTPPVVLKVKVKRQGGANTGACSGWPTISVV